MSSADPNAQSFYSPNWRHPSGKRSSPHEVVAVEDDVVTIGSHPPHPPQDRATSYSLINAISFSQTQDGFLSKVQESLERMGELSEMAQNGAQTETERQIHTIEFTQLQNRIKEIENKMFKAAGLFQPESLETAGEARHLAANSEASSSLRTEQLNECLEDTSNPARTTITDAEHASEAILTIHDALEAVADLRAQVSVDIQRLNSTGEQLSARDVAPSRADLEIRDGSGAEESTRFLKHDILRKSGTAMLAQANALPQSTLRLLG